LADAFDASRQRVEPHRALCQNELTAVTGVMQGTFTRPMPDGNGGVIKPTGKKYSINMATVGINSQVNSHRTPFGISHPKGR
jgi:hypothetical protein